MNATVHVRTILLILAKPSSRKPGDPCLPVIVISPMDDPHLYRMLLDLCSSAVSLVHTTFNPKHVGESICDDRYGVQLYSTHLECGLIHELRACRGH